MWLLIVVGQETPEIEPRLFKNRTDGLVAFAELTNRLFENEIKNPGLDRSRLVIEDKEDGGIHAEVVRFGSINSVELNRIEVE